MLRSSFDAGLAGNDSSFVGANSRSLDQQFLNVLNPARRDGVFVPWCYVLADATVSGTFARRTDCTLAKPNEAHVDAVVANAEEMGRQ